MTVRPAIIDPVRVFSVSAQVPVHVSFMVKNISQCDINDSIVSDSCLSAGLPQSYRKETT